MSIEKNGFSLSYYSVWLEKDGLIGTTPGCGCCEDQRRLKDIDLDGVISELEKAVELAKTFRQEGDISRVSS